jgi:hypothetical protein
MIVLRLRDLGLGETLVIASHRETFLSSEWGLEDED